jgi:L-ribulose-5-phosphate 3-epimerase
MQVREHAIAVCGWSLLPSDAADLVKKVKQLELQHVQIGLNPLLEKDETSRANEIQIIRDSGLTITATGISFLGEDYSSISQMRRTAGFSLDELWPARRDWAIRGGKLTAELGAKFIEYHIGFVPASSDPAYGVLVERVTEIATALLADGIELLIETGQEPASGLLQFLNDLNCRNVGVNFDPANMILYGSGDPIESIPFLGRHIKHVHVKDALAPEKPRVEWGTEVPFGHGEIDPLIFLDELEEIGYAGPLCIERESGENRMADIRAAIAALQEVE